MLCMLFFIKKVKHPINMYYYRSAGDTLTRRDYLRIIEEIYSCDFSSVSSDEDLHLNAVLNERCRSNTS